MWLLRPAISLCLSEDPGPHAVFFPVCEGLEGGWDILGDCRRRIGLDLIGLDRIGLDSIGFDWIRLDLIGLQWIGLDSIGLDSIGFDWIGLEWI